MKQIISAMLALTLVLTVLCVPAFAISDVHYYGNDYVQSELYISGQTISAYTNATNHDGYYTFTAVSYKYKLSGAGETQNAHVTSNFTETGHCSHTRTAPGGHKITLYSSNHIARKFGYTKDLYGTV